MLNKALASKQGFYFFRLSLAFSKFASVLRCTIHVYT